MMTEAEFREAVVSKLDEIANALERIAASTSEAEENLSAIRPEVQQIADVVTGANSQ